MSFGLARFPARNVDSSSYGIVQQSRALLQTPSTRGLVLSGPPQETPQFMETAKHSPHDHTNSKPALHQPPKLFKTNPITSFKGPPIYGNGHMPTSLRDALTGLEEVLLELPRGSRECLPWRVRAGCTVSYFKGLGPKDHVM